ncbi:ParA family protein [Belnapia sp. T18]|uniref:ParA family protein n=1 Tax=Belnapia arida TaxID=2804533 RepID=A0ABS1UCL5_9PROT|nr:AAA family ATPase [Belnapia arida]MBL6082423.1 ParA family protein [Belnapia arida]
MQGETFRLVRLRLRLSQGELKDTLNSTLGRSYDKPRISRWENGREAIPGEVAATLEALSSKTSRHARILAVANQKGGVGKTTTALNLAYALSRDGRRVLLIDLDPQATASVALLAAGSVEKYREGRTMAHVILRDRPLAEAIIRTGEGAGSRPVPFDLVASHIDLAESDGRREPGFEVALRESLDSVRSHYDHIVLDAPPNLGTLTVMALAAADEVLIPVRTEPYDTMGVGLILNTITKVQRRLNPGLRLVGVLPTQFGPRRAVDREVLEQLAIAMSGRAPILEPVPASAAFGHAARNGRIALEASPTAVAPAVYGRLAAALVSGQSLPLAVVNTSALQEI